MSKSIQDIYNKKPKFLSGDEFEIDKANENQKIFYMIENSELINSMINKIKKIQNINLIKKNII